MHLPGAEVAQRELDRSGSAPAGERQVVRRLTMAASTWTAAVLMTGVLTCGACAPGPKPGVDQVAGYVAVDGRAVRAWLGATVSGSYFPTAVDFATTTGDTLLLSIPSDIVRCMPGTDYHLIPLDFQGPTRVFLKQSELMTALSTRVVPAKVEVKCGPPGQK
jgi:hypothetical protein